MMLRSANMNEMTPPKLMPSLRRTAASGTWRSSTQAQDPLADEDPQHHRDQHDDDGSADELREGELPAEQQRHDDAELDDQVGGGELETIAEVKLAPLHNSDQASATAA